jgi:hypothetical protein
LLAFRVFAANLMALLLVAAAPLRANAALNEVWVSRNGADVASCGAILSPCRTLQYAHNAIVVPNGTIYIREPGSFGSVVITKPVAIIGSDSLPAAILQAAPGGIAVTINTGPNDKVFLKGLSLDGLDTGSVGVSVLSGSVQIEDLLIRSFRDTGLLVKPTAAGSTLVKVTGSTVFDTGEALGSFATYPSGCGAHVEAAANQIVRVTLVGSGLDRNLTGLCAQANGGRIWVTLTDSSLHGNAREGVWETNFAPFPDVTLSFDDATITDNGSSSLNTGAGLVFNGPTRATIANSLIAGNMTGVYININSTVESLGNNIISGNGVDVVGTLAVVAPQ